MGLGGSWGGPGRVWGVLGGPGWVLGGSWDPKWPKMDPKWLPTGPKLDPNWPRQPGLGQLGLGWERFAGQEIVKLHSILSVWNVSRVKQF